MVILKIAYSKDAAKGMTGLPSKTAQRLREKIETYAADPTASHGWAAPFGDGILRIRHGRYRAVCEIDHAAETLTILDIDHRKDVYR